MPVNNFSNRCGVKVWCSEGFLRSFDSMKLQNELGETPGAVFYKTM